MKGERILAELLSIIGLALYVVAWQHMMSEMLHQPDESWINKARLWWVTRGSREREIKLRKVWDQPLASEEP